MKWKEKYGNHFEFTKLPFVQTGQTLNITAYQFAVKYYKSSANRLRRAEPHWAHSNTCRNVHGYRLLVRAPALKICFVPFRSGHFFYSLVCLFAFLPLLSTSQVYARFDFAAHSGKIALSKFASLMLSIVFTYYRYYYYWRRSPNTIYYIPQECDHSLLLNDVRWHRCWCLCMCAEPFILGSFRMQCAVLS